MDSALVSIIIPVYNKGRYVEQCLQSVSRQTYRNIEIIIVNDGSTDESEDICLLFCDAEPRALYKSTKNSGVSAARNTGLSLATGNWVCFLDADDFYADIFVEELLSCVIKQDSQLGVLVKCSIRPLTECFKREYLMRYEALDLLSELYLPASVWGGIYKRDTLAGCVFREDVHFFEDFLFIYEFICGIDNVSLCYNEGLYNYQANDSSINSSTINSKRMSSLLIIPYIESLGIYVSPKLAFIQAHIIISLLLAYCKAANRGKEYGLQIQSAAKDYVRNKRRDVAIPLSYMLFIRLAVADTELAAAIIKVALWLRERWFRL